MKDGRRCALGRLRVKLAKFGVADATVVGSDLRGVDDPDGADRRNAENADYRARGIRGMVDHDKAPNALSIIVLAKRLRLDASVTRNT